MDNDKKRGLGAIVALVVIAIVALGNPIELLQRTVAQPSQETELTATPAPTAEPTSTPTPSPTALIATSTPIPTFAPEEIALPEHDWWWLKDMYPDIEYDQIICFVSEYGTSVVTIYVACINGEWQVLAYCYG